jgi:hypothetical protein
VVKEALIELNLGRPTLRIWVFLAEITDEFILGLNVLRAYNASVDVGRHLLRLAQEVTLWKTGVQPKSSRLSLVSNEVIPARCEKLVMASLEAPLGVTNILIDRRQKSSKGGVFIARTLVRAGPRVPVLIMNVTNQDQVVNEGTTIGHGEPAMWAAAIHELEPDPRRNQGLCKQLEEVIADARPNMSRKEAQALVDLIADYQDVLRQTAVITGGQKRCTTRSKPVTLAHSPTTTQTSFS